VGSFNRKVLVVEDDALLRSLIISKLEADGFVVQATDSAATARKIADDFDPDVALLDIELGNGPTGIDLALILRKSQPEIALVFLTHIPEPRVVGIDNRKIPKNAAYLAKDRITIRPCFQMPSTLCFAVRPEEISATTSATTHWPN
jgi:CheY-like chemotaxis protein